MGESEFFSGSKMYQFMAATSANLGAFGLGTVLSWTSPALASLKEDGYKYDETKESFLGSIVPIGALLACLVTGLLIGKLGRRTTMLITAPPFVAGWLIITFGKNYPMFLIGRLITGFCGGAFSLAAPVYVGEMSESKLRGMLGSGFQLMVVLGILFVYVLGTFVAWNTLALICAFIPAIFAICMFFMPESPRYYIIQGKTAEATASLMKFRGAKSEADILPEMAAIKASVEEARRNQASFKDLLHPSILKPVSISLSLMFFQQMSGINAVIFYTADIFKSAKSTIDENLSTIIVGIVQVVVVVVSTVLVDRAGRKILLLFSDIVMALSLVALGVFFYLKENEVSGYKDIGWLPLISLVLFIIAFSLGFGPIPWMMVGEILPPRALGLASSIATVFNWFLAFLVTQFFKGVQIGIGPDWCFWMFAIVCVVGTIYLIFILPETKGKSLDEIQALFGSSPNSSRSYNTYEGTNNRAYQADDEKA